MKNSGTDILEHSSGSETPEMLQMKDSKKTKNTIPKILCCIFYFCNTAIPPAVTHHNSAFVVLLCSEMFTVQQSQIWMTHLKC